ncbi:MAG: ribulose-phosphate 3-epimerase [Bacteroidetes bacterium SW_11_45_7]|nr:MAG: ribulose-phosphate 3-epimerase [Bacteroidetes bacterium SW_11_45_7]
MKQHLIAPSALAADFTRLADELEMVDSSEADWLHLDIMDGRFVPNISFGVPVIKAIRPLTGKPFDVHLMIVEPEKYFSTFQQAGADLLTVHLEVSNHLHRSVQAIHDLGMRAGVSLNPHTPVHLLEEILPEVDLVLLMAVNPGFGGQSFIQNTLSKITRLRRMIDELGTETLIEVDGGVNTDNAPAILKAGADVLVAGSSIFKHTDPRGVIHTMKSVNVDTIKT